MNKLRPRNYLHKIYRLMFMLKGLELYANDVTTIKIRKILQILTKIGYRQ